MASLLAGVGQVSQLAKLWLKTSLLSTESCALINSAMFLDEVLEVLERRPEHNVPMRPLGHVGQQRTVLQAHQCVVTSDVTQHTGTSLLALILRTTIQKPTQQSATTTIYTTINFTRLPVTKEVGAWYGRLICGWLGRRGLGVVNTHYGVKCVWLVGMHVFKR